MGFFDFLSRGQEALSNVTASPTPTAHGNLRSTPVAPAPQNRSTSTVAPANITSSSSLPSSGTGYGTSGFAQGSVDSGSSLGSSGSAYDPQELQLLDYQLNNARTGLGRIGQQRTIGNSNIDNSFQESQNQLSNQRAVAQRDYSTTKQDTGRDFANTRSDIRSNAGNQFSALQRLLGSLGAGRSTAATVLAPYAVGQESSQRFGQVEDAFGRNQRNIDTSYGDSERKYDELGREIQTQRDRKRNELYSGLAQNEIGIRDTIANLELGRQQLLGGNPIDALQPQNTRIQELLNSIDNYGRLYANSVNPSGRVEFNTPDLEAYNYSQFDSPLLRGFAPQAGLGPLSGLLAAEEEENIA